MKKEYKRLIIVESVIILVILITYIIVKTNLINLAPKCFFYENFGIFCPGCGGTRFISYIFQLKLKEAFLIQPIFFVLAIYLGLINLTYIINISFKKNIIIFKTWHIVSWTVLLFLHTLLINIL